LISFSFWSTNDAREAFSLACLSFVALRSSACLLSFSASLSLYDDNSLDITLNMYIVTFD